MLSNEYAKNIQKLCRGDINRCHKVSILSFIEGLVFFAIGVFACEVEFGFYLIFPFFIGSGIYTLPGILFIFTPNWKVAIIMMVFLILLIICVFLAFRFL